MLYLICNMYDKKNKEDPKVKNELIIREGMDKIGFTTLLVFLFFSSLAVCITCLFFLNTYASYISLAIFALVFIITLIMDYIHKNKYAKEILSSSKQKFKNLEDVLRTEFSIKSRSQIEALISQYQAYVNQAQDKEKKIFGIISAIYGVLFSYATLLSTYLNTRVDVETWLYLIVFLAMLLLPIAILAYVLPFFNSTKERYEIMIDDLNYLVIIILDDSE